MENFKTLKFTETEGGIWIESTSKYPKKMFYAHDFLEEVDEIIWNKPTVELDLSEDFSVNSRDISRILFYFKIRDIKVNFLNIAGTHIDEEIFKEWEYLSSNKDFKYLDISDTAAAETREGLAKEPKIIFIKKNILKTMRKELKKNFVQEALDRHKKYYEKNKSFTSAWEEGKFEGLNLKRVTNLFPDGDNELTADMKEGFLKSQSLVNLRRVTFKNQNIDDNFIERFCNIIPTTKQVRDYWGLKQMLPLDMAQEIAKKGIFLQYRSNSNIFARIDYINLNGNKDITENSLKCIAQSPIIGSIRDYPGYRCTYSAIQVIVGDTTISQAVRDQYNNAPQNTNFTITFLDTRNPPEAKTLNGVKQLSICGWMI